tara:strand:- start:26776 stop:27270 length:495 start_codon:yes stop_codon:yes gene_type:complete
LVHAVIDNNQTKPLPENDMNDAEFKVLMDRFSKNQSVSFDEEAKEIIVDAVADIDWASYWGNLTQKETDVLLKIRDQVAEANLFDEGDDDDEGCCEIPNARCSFTVDEGEERFCEFIDGVLQNVDKDCNESKRHAFNSIMIATQCLVTDPLKDEHDALMRECYE